MALKQSWLSKYNIFPLKYNEETPLFKRELNKHGLENKTTAIKYYTLPTENRETKKDCYQWVDADIFSKIEQVLIPVKLHDHTNNICSIIKTFYYRRILFDINYKENLLTKDFLKEFIELYQLFYENKVQSGKISVGNKGEVTHFKNDLLFTLILDSFKITILKDPETAILVTDIEQGFSYENLKNIKIENAAIFQLILYLQTKTDFIEKSDIEVVIKEQSFSNKFFELVYALLTIGTIIEDTNRIEEFKFLRTRVNRIFETHPYYINYFKSIDTEEFLLGSFYDIFPDGDYLNQIVANSNKIKKL